MDKKKTKKTKIWYHIPLLDLSLEILNKYHFSEKTNKDDKLLPVISNQKYNSHLKEIGNIAKIDKVLTSHAARHTFATIALTNKVSMESVAKMLGHSSIEMTKHYVRILDEKLSSVMAGISFK